MHASFVFRVITLLAVTGLPLAAMAQAYPSKSIRIVVAFSAGGTTDIVARAFAQKMTDSFGQTVLVDNRPGAGGTIGSDIVAKSPPDGYTLLIGSTSSIAVAPSLYSKIPWHPIRDFSPVSLTSSGAFVLGIHPSLPSKNVRELTALAKSRPGQMNFGSSGSGTSLHLVGELFKNMTGIRLTHVPYKGVGQAVVDLIAGQIELVFTDMPPLAPHVKSGRIRALAQTSAKRTLALPDLPTMDESGVKGFSADGWYGMLAPTGTPKDVVAKLHGEVVRVLALPDIRERFIGLGIEPVSMAPDQFGAYIKSEIAKWAEVIKVSGTKIE